MAEHISKNIGKSFKKKKREIIEEDKLKDVQSELEEQISESKLSVLK